MEYCAARGWLIVDEFVDDAKSRAEFKKRPGLIRMLNRARDRQFELVVLRDESRLGGDTYRTGLVIQDLTDAGVGIVHYITDELVSIDTAVDKFLVAARNFASELEREKISSRTYEHLMQKAKAGKPAGGISYGYAIVDKRYVVKEPEAAIVRRIFSEYAAGSGQRSIAHRLNEEGVPSPRAGSRGTGSWAPSAIRAMLTNPRYVGEGRYNQTRKAYKGGTKVRERRVLAEHFTYECPAIVDRATWDTVSQRFEGNASFGSRSDVAGAKPRYLLTGISRCGQCGGPITVGNRKYGRVNTRVYMCSWHKSRGAAVCNNTVAERVEVVNERVIGALRREITPEVVATVMRELRVILDEKLAAVPAETDRLRLEAEKLRKEMSRLTNAIATSDDPPEALVEALNDRGKRLRKAELELAAAAAPVGHVDRAFKDLEIRVRRGLRQLQAEFDGNVEGARDTLVALTHGERLRFEAEDGRFKVYGSVTVSGLVRPDPVSDRVASPAGFATVGNAFASLAAPRLPFVAAAAA